MSFIHDSELPRLLVISDVNVERTVSGALALYRLLKDYPPGKLMVIARPRDGWEHATERVKGAEYRDVRYGIPRAMLMRFNPFWPVGMAFYIRRLLPGILAEARAFQPEAVLGVAEGHLCFIADAVARKLNVPLHLIVHDDWTFHQTLRQRRWTKPSVRRACDWVIGRVLRRATTRFCVSPGMAELYETRYRVRSDVLLPSRGDDSIAPQVRVRNEKPIPFVAVYTGTIHHAWIVDRLRTMTNVLESLGGRLDLYVPYTDQQLADWGLTGPGVKRVGFFPAREMSERVASTAHVLFLPASFGERERLDVSTLFPSKLTDYTAIGLPILVWGPMHSSAARWASDNPGATELVTDSDPGALRAALERLADPVHATRVAAAGVAAGIRDFDGERIRRQFLTAISLKSKSPIEGYANAKSTRQISSHGMSK